MSELVNKIKENQPQFRNRFDAIVAILHGVFLDSQFKCVGVGENGPDEEIREFLPANWNTTDVYVFRYIHVVEPIRILAKYLAMGDTLLVHVMKNATNTLQTIELDVNNYLNLSANLTDYDHLYKHLQNLLQSFKSTIITKLTATPQRQRNPLVEDDPMGRYADDYGDNPGYGGINPGYRGVNSGFRVGDEDRLPPGRYGGYGGQGNLVGPRHPGFGGGDIFSGDRFHAPPPGARFDPFGPPSGPDSPRPRFPNNNPRYTTGPFSGPNNDEFMPPGWGGGYF